MARPRLLPDTGNVRTKLASEVLKRAGFDSKTRSGNRRVWTHPSGTRVTTPGGAGKTRVLRKSTVNRINTALLNALGPGICGVVADPETGHVHALALSGVSSLEEAAESLGVDEEHLQLLGEGEESVEMGGKRFARSVPGLPAGGTAGTTTVYQRAPGVFSRTGITAESAPPQPMPPEEVRAEGEINEPRGGTVPLRSALAEAVEDYETALLCLTDVPTEEEVDAKTAEIEEASEVLAKLQAELAKIRKERAGGREEYRSKASQALQDVRALCHLLRQDLPPLTELPTSRDVGTLSAKWRAALPERCQSKTVDRMRLLEHLATAGEFGVGDLLAAAIPRTTAYKLMRLATASGLITCVREPDSLEDERWSGTQPFTGYRAVT